MMDRKVKYYLYLFHLAPSLSYFNVSALEGGHSVLLEWEVQFDEYGGHHLTEFILKVRPHGSHTCC